MQEGLPPDGWAVAGWLWKAVLSIAAWAGYKQIERIDDLVEDMKLKADKVTVSASVSEVKEQIDSLSTRLDNHHHAVTTRLDTLLVKMLEK